MIPVIAFVGEKGSGKTTILEQVIDSLVERGRKVGVIKHTTHQFRLDYAQTDSARLYQAGAKMVAIAGEKGLGFYGKLEEPLSPEAMRDLFFPKIDLILTEGFKSSTLPKVLVMVSGKTPQWAGELKGLIAVVSSETTDLKAKHFLPDQLEPLVDLLEDYINRLSRKREVNIYLDGRKLQLKPFVKDLFLNTITALVGSLKETSDARRIQITIDLPEGIKVIAPGDK